VAARSKPKPPPIAESARTPTARRMRLAPIYGTASGQVRTWTHIDQRLRDATHYWVSTVDLHGRPHATPVDGIWMDGLLYFGGDPATQRQRNLRRNAAVCIHLESADDVVIVHGMATTLTNVDLALAKRLSAASKKKYGYGPTPEMYQASAISVLRPEVAFAWTDLTKDPTRFTFDVDRP
jgi:nitroimidazol reductase NimA-like FMN-containing flavoprotein (pyridoxamine 5'-phosphate oxidase superfamily)